MEFKDVVYGRRSVRKFKDTPVDDKILEEIVDAALWAPSGVNLQPWYYVVIRTPEKMTRLKEMMSVVSDRDKPHLEERFSAHPEVVKTTLSFISTLGGAPAVVLAFRDKPDYTWALLDEGVVQSVAASMENLVLSAYDHGVSSCWMTAANQAHMTKDLRDEFAPGPVSYTHLAENAGKQYKSVFYIVDKNKIIRYFLRMKNSVGRLGISQHCFHSVK